MMNWLKSLMLLVLVDLLNKTIDYDVKINQIKGTMPSITSLASTVTDSAVKNKIHNVSYLAKKEQIMIQK